MNIVISIIGAALIAYAGYRVGHQVGSRETAYKWTTYIVKKCVRLDLLHEGIVSAFEAAAKDAPEGARLSIDQGQLLKLIDKILEAQNKGAEDR